MKYLLSIVGFITLTAGCASYHQQVKENTLHLYVNKPEAQQVFFACSLDNFELRKARKVKGQWVVSLPLTSPFRYYYVIDKKIYIPPCRMKERDDFGSENCIFDPQ